jgi:hypothetical protein
MKKYPSLLIVLLLCINLITQAQETLWKSLSRGQTEHGYWVAQSHKEQTDTKRLTFYTKDHHLMYEEVIKSSKINLNRERTVNYLNQLLNSIAAQWGKEKKMTEQQLVYKKFDF